MFFCRSARSSSPATAPTPVPISSDVHSRPHMPRLDSNASTIVNEKLAPKTSCPKPAVPSLLPKSRESLRVVSRREYREVAMTLSHAFADDELSRYLVDVPDKKDRSDEALWKLHVDMMTYISACYLMTGEVVSIGQDYESIAMWLCPGDECEGLWPTIRSGLWKLKYQLSAEGKRRYYKEVLPLLHDAKLRVMGSRDNDCYYLIYLGTKPSGRCKGYASRLLRDMMAQADREQKPMYLESSSPANTEYYKKFGFVPKEDIYFGADRNFFLTAMVREPLNNMTSHSQTSTLNGSN